MQYTCTVCKKQVLRHAPVQVLCHAPAHRQTTPHASAKRTCTLFIRVKQTLGG